MNNNKYPLQSFLTVGELKKILENMSDDAIVSARDRDCINLEMMHVVGLKDKYITNLNKHIRFVEELSEVYGGREHFLSNPSKQAIIFCDCD